MNNARYYDKARRVLSLRRAQAISLNEKAHDELMSFEKYKTLDDKRSELFAELFIANKLNKQSEPIIKQIETAEYAMARFAADNHITTDNFTCKQCEDTGMVNGVYCDCLKKLIDDFKRADSGLTQLPDFKFKNHVDGLNPVLDKIYPKLIDYCAAFPDNEVKQLVFAGGVGVGKSCLAAAMANAVSAKGFSVQYVNSIEMNNIFLKYHTAPFAEREGVLSPLTDCDLLIIDDLGIEPIINKVTLPYLYILLEARDKLHTIITTNLNKDEIRAIYLERIFSRLFDKDKSLILSLTGKDLRLADKK